MSLTAKLVSDRHYRVQLKGMGRVHFKPGFPKDIKTECVAALLAKAPFLKGTSNMVAAEVANPNTVTPIIVDDPISESEAIISDCSITDETGGDDSDNNIDDLATDAVEVQPGISKKGRRRKRS